MFGFHALQLGHPGFGALRENRIPLIARVVDDIDPAAPTETLDSMDGDPAEPADTPDGESDQPAPQRQATPRVICRYDELPFASQSIDLVALQVKEITMFTIFRYANDYERAINFIASGQINVEPLISKR